MTLPADHIAPDCLVPALLAVADGLRAHATYLAVAVANIERAPVDQKAAGHGPRVQITPLTEDEAFQPTGQITAPEADALIGVVCAVAVGDGYEAALLSLRARVRAVLLQDTLPATPWLRLVSLDSTFAFEERGERVIAVCELRLRLAYQTDYPAPVSDPLDGIDIDVDLAPADGAIDARLVIDLPQD